MGLLFTLTIVVAIGALGWQRWQRSRAFKRAFTIEEDDAPRVILSHSEIDEQMRCTCGGKRSKEGEGPVSRGGAELWRVLTRCGSCGRRRALLFRLAS